jgi:DNA-binding transcriptional LysR family regulator
MTFKRVHRRNSQREPPRAVVKLSAPVFNSRMNMSTIQPLSYCGYRFPAAAAAGLGIVSTGLWNCRPELASGALVHLMADWQMTPIELHALFAAGRAPKPSARAFADYLASALSV